jgi:hypothetical protein
MASYILSKKRFFHYLHRCERHLNIHFCASVLAVLGLFVVLFLYNGARGSTAVNFSMSILPQPLAVTVVDEAYNPIEDPEVAFSEVSYAPNDCRELIAPLATRDQQIYIRNFDAADNGWTVTISTELPTATWMSGDYAFDFNDPTGDGCVDGDDPDILAGSMEIYIQPDALDSGLCPLCSSDFVNRVPDGVFDEQGGVNTVTLVYATSDSDNRGDWTLANITVRQTIPASQPAAGEYEIPLLLSITAN